MTKELMYMTTQLPSGYTQKTTSSSANVTCFAFGNCLSFVSFIPSIIAARAAYASTRKERTMPKSAPIAGQEQRQLVVTELTLVHGTLHGAGHTVGGPH